MTDPLRLFVLAGEASGDRIGADLLERLRARTRVEVAGVGGEALEALGLRSMFPMSELSVMGWTDVLPRLPLLLWRSRQVAQAILRTRPDVVVLIDAQEFSRVVARQVRSTGSKIPMLLYVAPAVWAWKPERAAHIRPLFDEVLAVLPFEPEVMSTLGGPPTRYVGHPAMTRIRSRAGVPDRGALLVLPGSREGELRRHLPLMREIARRFAGHRRIERIVLPTTRRLESAAAAQIGKWPVQVDIVATESARAEAFETAVAAVATMGTVTFELAMAGVPMVTAYVGDKGQARRFLKYRPRWASLPNAIVDRYLVPEIISLEPVPELVETELAKLLDGNSAAQLKGFAEVRALMEHGTPASPRTDPAERVLAHAAR
jgi:lipid-A-disaccharide synthase